MDDALNINQYRRHEWNDIKEDMMRLTVVRNVTRSLLQEYFSNQQGRDSNGRIKVLPAKYRATDYFDLPKEIVNNPDPVKETTIGLFLYNAFVLNHAFKGKVTYINSPLSGSILSKLTNLISDKMMSGELNVEEFAEYANTSVWLGYQTELFMPGVSLNMTLPNKILADYKKELLKKHPEFLTNDVVDQSMAAQYSEKIEKPLLQKANEVFKDDPAFRLYDVGKPSLSNNYKNSFLTNGPLHDPVSGKYKINTNSYIEGVNSENFNVLANKSVSASYSRSVNTAVGGTYAKYMSAMMQNVVCGPKDSDCGTKGYLDYLVTQFNSNTIKYNYYLKDGKLTRIEPDDLQRLIGKTIKMRSPLFCKSKGVICNKCIGDSYYILNISNIGLTAGTPPNACLNKSMKAMHDISIKTFDIDIKNFISFEF